MGKEKHQGRKRTPRKGKHRKARTSVTERALAKIFDRELNRPEG
jgi:hypothetical protein